MVEQANVTPLLEEEANGAVVVNEHDTVACKLSFNNDDDEN